MKPLVIYHKGCADGFCAAWIADRALGGADLHPAQYGDTPPDVAGREVYVLDFSYPKEKLLAMKATAATLVVLDHHKTAQADLADLEFCVFDMDSSGARLAFDFFANKVQDRARLDPMFPVVAYVQDRDLWRWVLPLSKEVSAAIASYSFDLEVWDAFNVVELGREGAAILRYQAQLVERIASGACEAVIDGHEVLAVNSPVLQSEVGEKLAEGRPFGAVWYEKGAESKVVFSLRSREGVDVSEVARSFGGGGHAAAAGFAVPTGRAVPMVLNRLPLSSSR